MKRYFKLKVEESLVNDEGLEVAHGIAFGTRFEDMQNQSKLISDTERLAQALIELADRRCDASYPEESAR